MNEVRYIGKEYRPAKVSTCDYCNSILGPVREANNHKVFCNGVCKALFEGNGGKARAIAPPAPEPYQQELPLTVVDFNGDCS